MEAESAMIEMGDEAAREVQRGIIVTGEGVWGKLDNGGITGNRGGEK